MKYLVIRASEEIKLVGTADTLAEAGEIMKADLERFFCEYKARTWKVDKKLDETSAELIGVRRCLPDEWGPYVDVTDTYKWQIVKMKQEETKNDKNCIKKHHN